MNPGKIAYEAYRNHAIRVLPSTGPKLPTWEFLDPKIREAWNAAAQAVLMAEA